MTVLLKRSGQVASALAPLGYITTLGGQSSANDARFSINRAGNAAVDVGAGDLCIECWVRGNTTTNAQSTPTSAASYAGNATDGNILFDGDGTNTGRGFIVGFDLGVPYIGVQNANGPRTLVGNASVLVDAWRHVCFQRRASSGLMQVLGNGLLQATVTGPTGSVAHAATTSDTDDLIGGAYEKLLLAFGYGGDIFMPRISSVFRYSVTTVGDAYTVPSSRFVTDANTAWLALMTDSGNPLNDDSGNNNDGTPLGSPPPTWTQGGPFA